MRSERKSVAATPLTRLAITRSGNNIPVRSIIVAPTPRLPPRRRNGGSEPATVDDSMARVRYGSIEGG